jgi:hypothetical protein
VDNNHQEFICGNFWKKREKSARDKCGPNFMTQHIPSKHHHLGNDKVLHLSKNTTQTLTNADIWAPQ